MNQSAFNDKVNAPKSEESLIPSFLRKVFDMLEEGYYTSFISWSEDGQTVLIHNPAEFAEKVLPVFFKHNNITSFIRQLNMYDFKKKKSKLHDFVFYHVFFQRGRRDLLGNMKRKNTKSHLKPSNTKSENSKDVEEENCNKVENNAEVLILTKENSVLKKQQLESDERIQFLERKLSEVGQKNHEIMEQVEKNEKRESLLKMVINQVACCYGPGVVQGLIHAANNKVGMIIHKTVPELRNYDQQLQKQNPCYSYQTPSGVVTKSSFSNFETAPNYRPEAYNSERGYPLFNGEQFENPNFPDFKEIQNFEDSYYTGQRQYTPQQASQDFPGFYAAEETYFQGGTSSIDESYQPVQSNYQQVNKEQAYYFSSEMSEEFKRNSSYF